MHKAIKPFIPTVTNMIRADHTHVLATFHQYEIDTSPDQAGARQHDLPGLEIHAQLEEEIFYPAMRAVAGDAGVVGKSVPEHDEMRRLIARLREMEPEDAGYDATVMELMRDVMHHVADEETILLPDAERVLADRLEELGSAMTKRRLELVAPRACRARLEPGARAAGEQRPHGRRRARARRHAARRNASARAAFACARGMA